MPSNRLSLRTAARALAKLPHAVLAGLAARIWPRRNDAAEARVHARTQCGRAAAFCSLSQSHNSTHIMLCAQICPGLDDSF